MMHRSRRFNFAVCAALALASCKLGKSGGAGADGGAGGPGLMTQLAGLMGFEGEIEMRSSSSYGTGSTSGMTMVFSVKKDKMRVEMPTIASTVSMVILIDQGAKKSVILMPASKTYFETPLGTTTSTAPASPKPTVTKTGKSDTVAGYSCDEYRVTDSVTHFTSVTCAASGLSFFGISGGPLKDLLSSSSGEITGFPLRTETLDPSGAVITKLEATRIEKKSEADSLFEIPPGYTKSTTFSPFGTVAPTTTASSPPLKTIH